MAGPELSSYALSQWRAIVICLVASIGAIQFGYDLAYFSGIITMPPFLKLYGDYDAKTKTYVLSSKIESITVSIINVGEFLGAITSFLVDDRIGRRGGLFLSSTCVIIGTTIQIADTHIAALIAGRLVLGYAVGLISCLVPLLVADCAPARFRGALVSMYQFFIGIGLLTGVGADKETHLRTDSGSFRIPMAVQYIFPLVLIPALVLFIPESPRWLLMKNKTEKARNALTRLNGPQPDLVEKELSSMQSAIERDISITRSSWADVFTWGPEGRKAYLGMALQAFQQGTGINFVTGYGVAFFFAIGIENPYSIQLGLYGCAVFAVMASQFCIERFGRRPTMLTSGSVTAAVLLVMGGCGVASHKSLALERAIVAMVFLFLVVFNLAWGPTVWVVTSEISTGRNRAKLMALSTCTNWLFNWLVQFTFPYLFNPSGAGGAGLGPRIGFLYASLTIAACVWVWFFLPETSGRSLEAIEHMFANHVPARKFKSYVIPDEIAPPAQDFVHGSIDEKKVQQIEVESV